MDWTAFTTILATGAVTLGSVALKGWFDNRSELRRIQGERDHAQAQLDREDRTLAAQLERDKAELRSARADEVVAQLTEILEQASTLSDDAGASVVESYWSASLDARARQAIERIHRVELRERMQRIADAIADLSGFMSANQEDLFAGWRGKMYVRMLIELAGCEARGDQPSADLEDRISVFSAQWTRYVTPQT